MIAKNIFLNSVKRSVSPLAHFRDFVIVGGMREPSEIPHDVEACRALIIQTQAATITSQATMIAAQEKKIEELGLEMEKLRKLLSHFHQRPSQREENHHRSRPGMVAVRQ